MRKFSRLLLRAVLVSLVVVVALMAFALPAAAAVSKPTVTTQAVSAVSYNTATANGNITSIGGANPTEKGFYYGTVSGKYRYRVREKGSFDTGAYTGSLTNLIAGKTYYCKAYAKNSGGISYGSEVTFTTLSPVAPTVTTGDATAIKTTSAKLVGGITATGGRNCAYRGFEWGTSSGVYTESWLGRSWWRGFGISTFGHKIAGLTAGETYYYRALAFNLFGPDAKVIVSLASADDASASWSRTSLLGKYSVKLSEAGTGDDGSTHVQFAPLDEITLEDFQDNLADYSFWHLTPATSTNWAQFELRFVDPDPTSQGWVEITAVGLQGYTGTGVWVEEILEGTTLAGYGGWGEAGIGDSFFEWGPLTALSGIEVAIEALDEVTEASDWLLERVRVELWEASPARTCYIDDITIGGVTYFLERNATYGGHWGYGLEDSFTTLTP